MTKQRQAKWMLSLSMVIFGTIGLFTRNIEVTSGELALYRAVLAFILLTGYLFITKQKINFKEIKRELLLLFLSGAAMGVNWILLFEAYKYTTISAATLSYYFAPVLVTIACPLLFRERMTIKQAICFVMSTIGLVLVIGLGGSAEEGTHFIGVLLGLGAACFYATVILLNKFIQNVEGIQRTVLQFFAAIVVLVPYVLCTGGMHLEKLSVRGGVYLLVIGIVHTGMNYCMYFSAIRELKGQEIAILSYLDPVVAVIMSIAVLGEKTSLGQLLGGILILGFTLWNEIEEKLDK